MQQMWPREYRELMNGYYLVNILYGHTQDVKEALHEIKDAIVTQTYGAYDFIVKIQVATEERTVEIGEFIHDQPGVHSILFLPAGERV